MKRTLQIIRAALALSIVATAAPANAAQFIVMSSTTSTEQSGLFAHLLPLFTRDTAIEVRVVAQGTGQALATARRGDADIVFVHDRVAEEKFVAEGHGLERREVMYNDFVVVGPRNDPAKIAGLRDVGRALAAIAKARAVFVSRGDKSGTHAAELRFWDQSQAGVPAADASWYRQTGSGMGPTLNVASGLDGYTLTDRGTWIGFRNRGTLAVLVEGDPKLFNQYGVIVVNPKRHPAVKAEAAQRFADWIVSPSGQSAIAAYRLGGEQLFFPNAAAR
ncbi:MAG: substrate-binding domain-containing protein [Burkholderiaceae bacterium]|nr:substrate-binding domain-containing protein [Burkholderiaceae bacterium]